MKFEDISYEVWDAIVIQSLKESIRDYADTNIYGDEYKGVMASMIETLRFYMPSQEYNEFLKERGVDKEISIHNLIMAYYMLNTMPELSGVGNDRTSIRNNLLGKSREELVDFILGNN